MWNDIRKDKIMQYAYWSQKISHTVLVALGG